MTATNEWHESNQTSTDAGMHAHFHPSQTQTLHTSQTAASIPREFAMVNVVGLETIHWSSRQRLPLQMELIQNMNTFK